jgi:hypothetical protein
MPVLGDPGPSNAAQKNRPKGDGLTEGQERSRNAIVAWSSSGN